MVLELQRLLEMDHQTGVTGPGGVGAMLVAPDIRSYFPKVEARGNLHLQLHFAFDAVNDPHQLKKAWRILLFRDGEEITDGDFALTGSEMGDQNQAVIVVVSMSFK